MRKEKTKITPVATLEAAWEKAWPAIAGYLKPISNKKQLSERIGLLDQLLDQVGDDEDHPLAALCDIVGRTIEEYEERNVPQPKQDPAQILAFLMEQRGFKQTDLATIIPQSNLSAVLNGRRNLTPKQISQLAQVFGVSPTLLLPPTEERKSRKQQAA